MILDEPTFNLDTLAALDLRRMVSTWKAQGKTVVIAEHRLNYLSSLIDRAVLMEDGRIIGDYTVSEIHALHTEQLGEMGLRPLDISSYPSYPVKPRGLPSADSIEIRDFFFTYKNGTNALNIDVLFLLKNKWLS